MNCYYCRHPLMVASSEQPTLKHQQGKVWCPICRTMYQLSLTVLHGPEREGEELDKRMNRAAP